MSYLYSKLSHMKPRLFIGSSKEGVDIALAIQQNLRHDAENTVWSQGVFDLSVTTLDSLLEILERSDLGVFVLSPDDIAQIRGKESLAARDNVIFELGLFIGKLSKIKCFMLIPDGDTDLHLPTDLVGMTPATYEANRSDENMEAATGPACQQIRKAIKKLGTSIQNSNAREGPPPNQQNEQIEDKLEMEKQKSEKTPANEETKEHESWIDSFFAKDYQKAIHLLEIDLSKVTTDEERLYAKKWIARMKARTDLNQGLQAIEALISEHPDDYELHLDLALAHKWKDRYPQAFAALERGLASSTNKSPLINLKAQFLRDIGEIDQAISFLHEALKNDPEYEGFYTTLADLHLEKDDKDDAVAVLKAGLSVSPNNEQMLSKLGNILDPNSGNDIVLFIYTKLTSLFPKNPTYLTLLGNSYLSKDLYGLALEAYQRANELAEEKQAWIIANIGNIFKNKGFNPLAIEYLKKALSLESESLYTHDRLAQAIKNHEEEQKKLDDIRKSAKKSFYSSPSNTETNPDATNDNGSENNDI